MPNGNQKPAHATVRRSMLAGKKVPDALSTLANTCSAGAQCQDVQNSPLAKQALGILQAAVATAQGSLTSKQQLAQAVLAAIKALKLDFEAAKVALVTYESAVLAIADGDASIINKAGLLSRDVSAPHAALGKVTVVYTKPGKNLTEAVLNWPAAPGATGYAIEVSFTPGNPGGPFTALPTASSRRRVVKGTTPGCQFLARVAAVASDGSQSEWTDAILCTAR